MPAYRYIFILCELITDANQLFIYLIFPQNIYDNIHKHERELLIALRFIEWFTNRGDIYEYNMKVIDNHLKNISTSSIPSVGRYQGETSTRFTPLPNPKQPLSRNK